MELKKRVPLRAAVFVIASTATFAVLSAATADAPPKGSEMKVSARVEPPAVIAVRFRHDMCPYCQAMDREIPGLIKEYADRSVLWVTLDLTDETSQKQAALLAGALGIESVWTGDMTRIGSVTLIDGTSKTEFSAIEGADARKVRRALARILE